DWIQPPDKDLPLVSTIHDLAMLKFPETAHPKLLSMHKQSWKILKQRTSQIIAVSRATKRDIIELLDIPAERIHVIHEALPNEVVQIGESLDEEKVIQIIGKLGLTRPYLLAVGTREPRKNLERLIEAWEPLSETYDLVIAGEQGWDATSKGKKISDMQHLRLLGRVDDTQLAALYTNAAVFCYPSLYEGFGLPILEAFYFDVPVVTSNLSSMPEIAGNAAELVDPLSVESIREGIMTILNESEEQRHIRRQRMVIRQHMFSWRNAAEQTAHVYQLAAVAAAEAKK
ncbi:glycosyltransferase family 4 protein, partial [Candidatus Woesebacteria bacterium]|nr:glycosyltransferase family 4 protein [Candidatus Woesebacteria bacterium]